MITHKNSSVERDGVSGLYDQSSVTPVAREFIRHPSSIPIGVSVVESSYAEPSYTDTSYAECGLPEELAESADRSLINISKGGVCFSNSEPLEQGVQVRIEIFVETPSFVVCGSVVWCRSEGDHYVVGVVFDDDLIEFQVRMVEQVCHIEQYRLNLMNEEQRQLSSEEAAAEWIKKYAADFPGSKGLNGV